MRVTFKCRPAGWGLGLLLLTPMMVIAEEAQDEVPSLDFLEFLGEWEDAQGNWQDPLEYEEPDVDVEQNNEAP